MIKTYKIVGLGEVLFDLLPTGKMLGGAPANFAYIANQLGDHGIIASSIGNDEDGAEIIRKLKSASVDTSHLQTDKDSPTGTVKVTLIDGQPEYEITADVAWDDLRFTDEWRQLASECDAVCFGSLAQRGELSRKTIRDFVSSVRTDALKIFDVNLRQSFYNDETLLESIKLADVVKLNHEELPIVAMACGINANEEVEMAKALREKFGLKVICLTRGANGSILISADKISEHSGIKIDVADAIGAGDSFTATMAHGLLRDWDLDEINDKANQVAAFIASQAGAMPSFTDFRFK